MPTFGQDFLKGFIGNNSLRDYTHASKTFTTNAYELKPRYKFLFHVSFTVNVAEIPFLNAVFSPDDLMNLSLTVKTIDLPKFQVDTETLNQYNRKRIIQKKINYDPISVTFHDTSNDLNRKLWYYYMSYYYKDPTQRYLDPNNTNGTNGVSSLRTAGFGYNDRDIYDSQRIGNVNDWGYIGESYADGYSFPPGGSLSNAGKPPFFRDIRIYGLNQRTFAEYVLINPMITEWQHDTYDYSQGNGMMTHRMTMRYETVKYMSGAVGGVRPDTNVVGFADPAYYDTVPSALARPGSTQTVLGRGGLIDAGVGIVTDLQSGGVAGIVGALQKAGTAAGTFKDKSIRSIVNQDIKDSAKTILRTSLPAATRAAIGTVATSNSPAQRGILDGIFFPTPPRG